MRILSGSIILAASSISCHSGTSPNRIDNTLNRFDNTMSQSNAVSGDVDSRIPDHEIGAVRERALRGGTDAPQQLAQHYQAIGQFAERRRWLVVAANRGGCAAIALLKDDAQSAGNRRETVLWNDRLRQNNCTWEKAYGPTPGDNSGLDAEPLWENSISL